jgi:hypothetical protein
VTLKGLNSWMIFKRGNFCCIQSFYHNSFPIKGAYTENIVTSKVIMYKSGGESFFMEQNMLFGLVFWPVGSTENFGLGRKVVSLEDNFLMFPLAKKILRF